jgi:hypothetical protein
MDEMIIRSDFVKNIISKLIMKALKSKLGVSPNVTFNEPIRFWKDENYADLDLNLHISMSVEDLSKLLKDLV